LASVPPSFLEFYGNILPEIQEKENLHKRAMVKMTVDKSIKFEG